MLVEQGKPTYDPKQGFCSQHWTVHSHLQKNITHSVLVSEAKKTVWTLTLSTYNHLYRTAAALLIEQHLQKNIGVAGNHVMSHCLGVF